MTVTRTSLLTAALALGLAAPLCAQTVTTTTTTRIEVEGDVADLLDRSGYTDVTIVRFDGERWLAEATAASGERVELQVDPADGRVIPLPVAVAAPEPRVVIVPVPQGQPLTAADVRTLLVDAGYHDVRDVEFDNDVGLWKAEARDADGDKWELQLDAMSGQIVHIEED